MVEAISEPIRSGAVAALAAIREGKVTAEALTAEFLDTIDDRNPGIGALGQVLSAQALARARDIDGMISGGRDPGPLAGLPVVVKENCDTAGAVCSAGLAFRRDHEPERDSWITARLKDAGAVVLGVSLSDPGAFDVRTPAVTHPVDPLLTVGGSSGGSAAALAAGLCLGAIGTDTGGSIRIPSACCGTVGLKPTFGALPMEGIFPLVQSLDHVGPMARSVADVEVLWHALSDGGPSESERVGKIGVDPRWIAEIDEPLQEQFAALLRRMAAQGVQCIEVTLPEPDQVIEMHGTIFLVESAAYHLAHHGEQVAAYPEVARGWFDAALAMPVRAYVEACKRRKAFTERVDALLAEVDGLLLPTIPVAGPKRAAASLSVAGEARDYTMALVRHTCLFDHTGHPALALPGSGHAEPGNLSVQLVGRYGAESQVLRLGAAVEKTTLADRG